MSTCKVCGAELAPTNKFCTNCGTPTGVGMNTVNNEEKNEVNNAVNNAATAPKAQETITPGPEAPKAQETSAYGAEAPKQETAQQTGYPYRPVVENSKPETDDKQAHTYRAAQAAPQFSEELKPLSMWAYFGYEVLFAIPCIGLVFLLIFALGGAKNVNLKNFARSHFCFLILICIIGVIVAAFYAILGGMIGGINFFNYIFR